MSDYVTNLEDERRQFMASELKPDGSSYSYPSRVPGRRINIVSSGNTWRWVVGDNSLITCSINPSVGANGAFFGKGTAQTLGEAWTAAEKCAAVSPGRDAGDGGRMVQDGAMTKLLDTLIARFVAWAGELDRQNKAGRFGKYPWQRDYGLWPWQRMRKR